MTPEDARRTWRSLETVHGMIYFTPLAAQHYSGAGVSHHRTAYFASRSAPMGAVNAHVVIATFYNFNPTLVHKAMDGVWEHTTPDAILRARLAAVDESLTKAFGTELIGSAELRHTAELLRRAALVATRSPEGRPLFAGHASLPWPEEPHLVLWHAQSLLREFRGDGHVAALAIEGLSGLDALVSHGASGDVPPAVLQRTRAWSDDEWASAVASLAERGLVDSAGAFTDAGRAQRARIEETTDRLAAAPYQALGDDACGQVREMGKKLTALVMDAGLMPTM